MPQSVALYRRIYRAFRAPVSRYDCGRKCAPLNGGVPVCCDTEHALPIVDRHEWRLLDSRSDLWRLYLKRDAETRRERADMHRDCRLIACKGAEHCERENRSLSCRAFPFFPYITAKDEFAGLAPFWTFADRCWLMNNLQVVDRGFVGEFVAAHELLFAADKQERAANREHSAAARRVFTRWNRLLPLIGRAGEYLAVEPRSHRIRPADWREYLRHETFRDEPPAPAVR
jgi:hypothetical protein